MKSKKQKNSIVNYNYRICTFIFHMIKLSKYLLLIVLTMSLSSCFELIEDTTLHADGSGSYKLTLNLSSSTTRINSIMAMDTIDGKKVPSRQELKTKMQEYISMLNSKEGISYAEGSLNTENWIIKLDLNFASLAHLKAGLIDLSKDINQHETSEEVNQLKLSYANGVYQRELGAFIPEKWKKEVKSDEDFSRLKEGKCIFIQRFDQEVAEVSSTNARISKSKKAVMLQLSPLEIVNNPQKIDYSIKTIH